MNSEKNQSQLLISATTSHRRNLALRQLENIDLKVHPGPKNELESDDTTLVAKAKVDYLMELIQEVIKNPETAPLTNITLAEIIRVIDEYHGNFKIIAADVRTETLEKQSELEPERFVSHGKPKDLTELQKNFYNMNKTRQKIYQVFAGSQILQYSHDFESPIETRHAQRIQVKLRPEILKNLINDQGIEDYVSKFREFYSSSTYSKNGLPAVDFTDLSAGLSLPVLIKAGYVEEIGINNRTYRLGEAPKQVLKQVIYGVAVGYSPHVLEKIYPGAYEFIIDNWDWLEDVVNHVKK